MDVRPATFTSDEVNRYGYSLGIEALAGAVAQAWEGTPMFVSHDYHRPLGISRPMGLQLHASRALLKGEIYFPTTEEEEAWVEGFARQFLAQKIYVVDSADEVALVAPLDGLLSDKVEVWRRECVSVIDPGIAKRKFPSLFPTDETDKRSLVPISELDAIAPGVFRMGELVVFAHRYFRRSLSQINNTNDAFLRRFFELQGQPGLVLKIALDPDSVGLASSCLTPIELEYWRGPKFDDNLASIPVGVAVHKASRRERIFHGVERTEFFWHMQNGMRSFECEELLDRETLGIGADVFGCRYAHSIIDEATSLPNHLDGAIRVYKTDQYLDRIETDISKAGKNSRYVKLWRIDGPIDLSAWKELVCDFFRGNSLPGEYLGGIPDSAMIDEQDHQSDESTGSLMSPAIFEQGDLQIAASYHRPGEFPEASEGGFVPGIGFMDDGVFTRTIELSALDLIKLIQRALGRPIQLSPGIVHVAIEDMDINHPLVFFGGEASVAAANVWKSALATLCQGFVARGERRFITASVGIDYGDVVIKFSFAGFVSLLAKALTDLADFPRSADGVGPWCISCYGYLKQHSAYAESSVGTSDLFRIDGTFRIDRPYVDPNLFSVDEQGITSIKFPPREKLVAEALHEGRLFLVTSVKVKACKCSGCGASYLACPCSAFVDEGVELLCESIEGLRWAITERSAQ